MLFFGAKFPYLVKNSGGCVLPIFLPEYLKIEI